MKDCEKPIIERISFMQEPDCCDGNEEYQRIEIGFHDGGGGYFWRIESADRWAVDAHNASIFTRYLNQIADRNTRITEAQYKQSRGVDVNIKANQIKN